mgnify:CR=1 FL=1
MVRIVREQGVQRIHSDHARAVTGAELLLTAFADGALVTRLTARPRATASASSLILFLVKESARSVFLPIDSHLLVGNAETKFSKISEQTPMFLEAGDRLYVGSQVALAAGIVFRASWKVGKPPFIQAEEGASLILDFSRNLYGVQVAEEANANAMNPLPSLALDFSSEKYFVGDY